MTRFFRHPWGWATVAPLACAVHCMVTPLLVLTVPNLAPGATVEWILLGITVVAGGAALGFGIRMHEDLRPAVPVALGLGLWTFSLLYLFRPIPEELTTVAATLIVAGGLFWNSRLHCARRERTCPVCTEPDSAVLEDGAVMEAPPAPGPATGVPATPAN